MQVKPNPKFEVRIVWRGKLTATQEFPELSEQVLAIPINLGLNPYDDNQLKAYFLMMFNIAFHSVTSMKIHIEEFVEPWEIALLDYLECTEKHINDSINKR